MNSFEKKAMVKYLVKLIPIFDINNYSVEELIDEIIKEYKLKDCSVPEGKGRNGNITREQKQAFYKEFLKKLKETVKDIKSQNTILYKQMQYIKNIFSLDEKEYAVLEFYSLAEVSKIGDYIFDCIDRDLFDLFCKHYLHLDYYKSKNKLRSSIVQKGIFENESRRNSRIQLREEISEIISDKNVNTERKIQNKIIGKPAKSNLVWKDFDYYSKDRKIVLNILKNAVENKQKGVNIFLYGDVGTGKTQFAKLIANKAKIDQYEVRFESEDKEESGRNERLMDLYAKQTILSKFDNSCILFDEAEDIFSRMATSKAYVNNILENTPVPVFWTTNDIKRVDPAFLRRMTYTIGFEKLTDENRLTIWKRIVKKHKFDVDDEKLEQLNKAYDVSPSIIENAIRTSKLIGGTQEDFEMFVENVAKVVSKKKSVKKKKEFEMKEYDINLINTDLNMDDLTNKIQNSGKLNFSMCMYGEPGTGKSLYARYLAKELGIEVVQKRASDMISMWVGQTEQNIAAAFAEAKAKKAMLIFDEADSFLQNRSNAGHSWEVSQVNEMLTWMESHEYPFVCTTNLLDTLDEASLRRFTFKIKFDFMNAEQVNLAVKHFFNIEDASLNIKGLTAGDFSTVKKKADFLNITDINEIAKMLQDEVKLKNAKSLKNVVGF